MLLVAIIGAVLGAWTALTSLGRCCRHKSICFNCTLPRLSLFLVPLHHVPVFVLVTFCDFTLFGGVSAAGALDICTSMVALVNALRTTKCGECGAAAVVTRCYDDHEVDTGAVLSCGESYASSNYEKMV